MENKCYPKYVPETLDPAIGKAHSFKDKPVTRVTYCSGCQKIVHTVRSNKPGVVCASCGIICHHDCQNDIRHLFPCAPSFVKARPPSLDHAHYFVMASTNKGTCITCQRKIYSNMNHHLSQYKCSFCNQKACSFACYEQAKHSKCVIPNELGLRLLPTQFITNGITDIKEIGKFSIVDVPPNSRPFICFVHPKSGGCLGEGIIKVLSKLVNPGQIFNLMNGGPEPGLRLIMNNPDINFIVAACGGDGTAAWVFSVVDKLGMVCPPLAHCPLGTGNDLSRTLGWGPGMNEPREMKTFIRDMAAGVPMMLDRWKIEIKDSVDPEAKIVEKVMNNYWSIGIDAKIALKFHEARTKDPASFQFQALNKMWYAKYGSGELFSGCPNLQKKIIVEIDDVRIDLVALGELEGIIILNLPNCYGGACLWADKPKGDLKPQRINDGLFEVVGLKSSFHLGNCQTGLASPVIVGQGKKISIAISENWPVQLDGEPWMQTPSVITITFHTKSTVLTKRGKAHPYLLGEQAMHIQMTEPETESGNTIKSGSKKNIDHVVKK
jgi:diacylglycerol kinase (ATP)